MPAIIGIILFIVIIIFTCECIDNYIIPPISDTISYAYDNILLLLGIVIGLAGLFFLRVFILSGNRRIKRVKVYKAKPAKTYNKKLQLKTNSFEMEENIMESSELENFEEHIEKEISDIPEMKPVQNLDFEGFANHAANLMDNPEKYSDFITGWFFRGQITKANKAVVEFQTFMSNMRLASINTRELQTELLKNKYLLKYQALIAVWEAKQEYKDKMDQAKLQEIAREAEKNRLLFISDFYKNANAKDLTPSERMLYLSQTPIQSSKLQTSELGSFSEAKTYVNPTDVLKIEQEKELLKMAIRKTEAEYEEKIERNKILEQEKRSKKAQADLDEHTAKIEIRENPDSK